ncbi:MAG: VWA domain-containing protein [Prevotellaceae bacterium]|nr:VWA domain-containing protein [Prevotellaceae bacterium]
MLQFAQPEYLWLLLLIPVMLIAFALYLRNKRKALSRFGDVKLMTPLMPAVSKSRGWFKIVLLCLAWFFLAIGLCRPQIGAMVREMKSKGVEIIIALDVSNSMLAEDFKPNRLERAKLAISRLVDRLHDDRIGLIVFAGDAYVQLPVTTDYVSAKTFLLSISPDIVSRQGTAIGKAISLATRSYTLQSEKSRALIVITDGEDHETDAIEAAKNAAEAGIVIYTIGIGSVEGQPIPTKNGMLKDKDGNIVVTRLNENILQDVANAGNGNYTHATNSDLGLDEVVEGINNMEKQDLNAIVFENFNEQFMYLFAFALFLLIAEIFVLERKNRWAKSFDIFKKTFLIVLLWSLSLSAWSQVDKKDVREGVKLYKDSAYHEAEIAFRRGLEKDSTSYVSKFGLGNTLYKQNLFEQAETVFQNLVTPPEYEASKAKLMHNLGNVQLQQKKYKESVESYKQSLRLNPSDDETRSNLAYAQLMLQKDEQQQNNNKDNKDQDKKDKQDKKDEQQNQEQNQNDKQQQDKQDKKDDKNDRQPQPKISPQQAQQILDAVQADEKETQEKVKKEKAKAAGKYKTDKNW